MYVDVGDSEKRRDLNATGTVTIANYRYTTQQICIFRWKAGLMLK